MTYDLPPLRGYAVTPDVARFITLLVQGRPPDFTVLECGSGASTVLLAHLLPPAPPFASIGRPRVTSLEHSPTFRDKTAELLAERDLTGHVDLRLAPLVETDHGLWYDPAALTDLRPVDLLFVDGPPGSSAPLARYPAIPLLAAAGLIAPNCLILVDDADRPDESEAVRRWAAELPLRRLQAPVTDRGLALLCYEP